MSGECDRARQWASTQLDGELSSFERVLLARASRCVPGLQRVQQRDRRPDRDAPRGAVRAACEPDPDRPPARRLSLRLGFRLRPRWPSPRSPRQPPGLVGGPLRLGRRAHAQAAARDYRPTRHGRHDESANLERDPAHERVPADAAPRNAQRFAQRRSGSSSTGNARPLRGYCSTLFPSLVTSYV